MIPPRVRVGPHNLEVVQANGLISADFNVVVGDINLERGIIRLQTGMSTTYTWTTLFHEVIHGILDNAGKAEFNSEEHDHIVDVIATGVVLFLFDNPTVLSAIQEIANDVHIVPQRVR